MRYLVANLKMKLTSVKENTEFLLSLSDELKSLKKKGESVRLVACPSFPFLDMFRKKLPKSVMVGAQNMSWEDVGAYTGEVSPRSLFDIGAAFVIIGHSERRKFLGESDQMIAKKVSACFRNTLRPIVCMGETESERLEGKTLEVIRRQVKTAFLGVSREDFIRGIIAYEPRWAIGSDRTPTSDEIMEISISIRRSLVELFDRSDVDMLPILYGGSVSADRINELCLRPGLSGVLVGRESLNPQEIMKMLRVLAE